MDSVFGFEGFQWDSGNSNKNLLRHNVQNWECEQDFYNQPLAVLADSEHSESERRWAVFGKTDARRLLVMIFTRRNNLLRIISARDMNRLERKYYEEYENKSPEI